MLIEEAEVLCPDCGMVHDRMIAVEDEAWLFAVDTCPVIRQSEAENVT